MSLVTIWGPLGSGAPEIGKQIADRLQAEYVDRQIMAEAAALLHRQEQELISKENLQTGLLDRIVKALENNYTGFGETLVGAYLSMVENPLDDALYLQTLQAVISDLARSESIVILGRGSQFIIKDLLGALHVLVVAPIEVRVQRLMHQYNLDEKTAKREIGCFDNSSREFIKRYFKAEVWDPVCYDLVVNTRYLSLEAAASIVIEAFSRKKETLGKQGRNKKE
jgi:cytidylate kinase